MDAAQLVLALEALSRERPDRVLRLIGTVPSPHDPDQLEPFELLIYRGFSSSTTHPTAFDPDTLVVPVGVVLSSAQLLQGPLDPAREVVLLGPDPAATFLEADRW